jgi:hypothetical protein
MDIGTFNASAAGSGNMSGADGFANVNASDFRLTGVSAAIDQGLSAGAPANDYAGPHRPAGAGSDIRAYEYQLPVLVTITSSPSGVSVKIGGTGCSGGTYSTPVNLTWTAQAMCSVAFGDPQSMSSVSHAFQSSAVNGFRSHENPLTVNSGTNSVNINATYAAFGGGGSAGATRFSVAPVSFSAVAGVHGNGA